jgi:hypothetical protein
MAIHTKVVLLICMYICFQASQATACRYNVRETGFVDLGTEPYFLLCFVSDETPAETMSTFASAATPLEDSNVRLELVNIDQQKEHPAMNYFHESAGAAGGRRSAVLVSPDGQTMDVGLSKPDRPFKESLAEALNEILFSPVRLQILHQCATSYCAILLIEGPDKQDNDLAREAIRRAIETVKTEMQSLPKPITQPPATVVLDVNSLAAEKVLLWSMGLDVNDVNAPHAAVFYGRGRWIGPLFKGRQITEDLLLDVIYVVGSDCECGLDYRWVQGTMLPAKWDGKLNQLVVESAAADGFDPENPMIKMEIGSIISRSISAYRDPDVPTGYQELLAASGLSGDQQRSNTYDSHSAAGEDDALRTTHDVLRAPAPSEAEGTPVELAHAPVIRRSLYVAAVAAACILLSGLYILLRAHKRRL